MKKTQLLPSEAGTRITLALLALTCAATAAPFAKFHGKDGDFLTDETGNGRDLIEQFSGSAKVVYHPAGFFRFPGTEGADEAWVEWTGGGGSPQFTVSFWMRSPSWSQGSFQGFYTNVEPGSFDYQMDLNGTDFRLLSDPGVAITTPAAAFPVNTWLHVVIRKTGSGAEWYITEVGQPSVNLIGTDPLNLGGIQAIRFATNRNRDSFPECDIANVQVYNDDTVDLNLLLAEGPDLNPVIEWDPADDDAGGAGNWDTASLSWQPATGDTPNATWAPNDGTQIAFLGGSGDVVTLTEPISVDELHVGATNYTIDSATAADTLTIASSIFNNRTLTISSPLAGSGAISKQGGAQIFLSGDSPGFSGSYSTDDGETFVTSDDWSNASFITTNDLLHFDNGGGTVTVNSVSLDTGLRVNNGTRLDIAGGILGQIGGGGWISTETGTLGSLTSSGGTLNLTFEPTVTQTIQLMVGVEDFDGGTPLALNIVGAAPGTNNNLNILEPTSYTGGTTIDDIRVFVGTDNAFGTGPVDVLDEAQISLLGTTVTNDVSLTGLGWTGGANVSGAMRFADGSTMSGNTTIAPSGSRITVSGGTALMSGDLLGSGNLEYGIFGNPGFFGTLDFTGAGAGYNGLLTISTGLVNFYGNGVAGDVIVDDTGELGGNGTVAGKLTLGTTGGATLRATAGGFNTTDLVLNGTTNLDFYAYPMAPGTPIPVLSYSGTLSEDGAAGIGDNFALLNPANHRSFGIVDNAMTLEVDLGSLALLFDGTLPDWDVGNTVNWNAGTERFFDGDTVTFDDTAASSAVKISGPLPNPAAITVNNNVLNYSIEGELGTSAGDLTKFGIGFLDLIVPDDNMPYTGNILIDSGTVALTGDTQALRNVESISVNPGGAFRVSAGNAGQDNLPPLKMLGGTLEVDDDDVFLFPASSTMSLAPATSSTLSGTGNFYPFTNSIAGPGNLIKDGTGTLDVTFADLDYTGTTTLNDGLIRIGAGFTAASTDWTINGGELRLGGDSGAPIENLPFTVQIVMTDGRFYVVDNKENTQLLAMDSTGGGFPTVEVDPATTSLTTNVLDLNGIDNRIKLPTTLTSVGPHPVITYTGGIVGVPGVNLVLDPATARPALWNDNAGTLEVTLQPQTHQWTGAASTFWEVGGPDTNWTSTDNLYYNFDAVEFTDVGAGTVLIDDADGDSYFPGKVTFSNTAGNDYALDGSSLQGDATFNVVGGGRVELLTTLDLLGDTTVSNGSILIASTDQADSIHDQSQITVGPTSELNITETNSIQRDDPASEGGLDGDIIIDGGTLTQSGGTHAHIGDITLLNQAQWTATSPDSFNDENVLLTGKVTVGGAIPSTIGPMTFGMAPQGLRTFEVADVTGDASTDLLITAELENSGGAGGVNKTGPGTLEFDAVNTYTGQTRVVEGTVTVNNTAQLYSTGGFFGNNGTTYVFIEGGTLETDRFGYGAARAFSELRNNYYSILIDGGTLRLTGNDPANDTLRSFSIGTNGATLEVAAGGFYRKLAGTVASQNIIYNDLGGDLTLTGEGTGVIEDDLGSYGAGWAGVSLIKDGPGTWLLEGTNTYTGDTLVNDGVLGGSGSVTSNVIVAADASLAPGSSAGTLTIDGNLDLTAPAAGSGILDFELDAIGASDQIVVTGDTALGNGVFGFSDFNFTNLGGLENGVYVLVQSGTLTGTFDGADLSGPIGSATGMLQINNQDIELVVTGAFTPFEDWIENTVFANPGVLASPADKLPGADPDGDGVDNIGEFGFDGDPTDGANNGKVFLVTADGDDGDADPELILTFAARLNAVFNAASPTLASVDGVDYSVAGTLDLSDFTAPVSVESTAVLPPGAPPLSVGWEYRSVSLDGSDNFPDKGFMRASATETP
ncbi:hypothetical protein HAHE_06980 [Haloferula helveola]|uniref:Uncharacterized protein n=1 Tax=Haloferula helveola TaxID=490095 RepID=A0ABM7R7L5_9BACT|nr:hypothetical protein HAHE_06980 [Haloferula helveola]